MDHEFDRAMLSCLSWSLYQPASTARRTVDNSDDPNPFKRLTYVPLSADDRGRTVLTGEITALLGGEYEVAVSIGARGQPTSLGGVLGFCGGGSLMNTRRQYPVGAGHQPVQPKRFVIRPHTETYGGRVGGWKAVGSAVAEACSGSILAETDTV